jgi:hypothetical protein
MICRQCDYHFENWILVRLATAILAVGTILLGTFAEKIADSFPTLPVDAVGFIFLFGGLVAIIVLCLFKEYQEWSEHHRMRQLVNYGSLALIVVSAAVYLMKKSYQYGLL